MMMPKASMSEGFTEEMLFDCADTARHALLRPLGRLMFTARKVRLVMASSRLARREADAFARDVFSIEGISDCAENTEELYRQRRETHYQEGVSRLIESTLEEGLGSDRFLAELAPLTDD